ncbi:MAG: 50S ribosomal protein L11 methyltransferase [Chlamydiae bacterium]|nr:50S ribosomal protein L11 methyltransferase [Chlamydiota bacterium]
MIKEVSFKVRQAEAENFSDSLMEMGALSVSVECIEGEEIIKDEKSFEAEYWDINKISALIKAEDEPLFLALAPFSSLEVPDLDWVLEMQKNTPVQVVADTLWIVPSWHEVPKEAKIVLLLDPRNAFGTGDHPTTNICLEWLVKNPPVGKTVVDYGCGSGILMIAAKKLGAKSVRGFDIDSSSMKVAKQNCLENGLSDPIDLDNIEADLVLANIHLGPLLSLADTLSSLCKSKGTLVLSGILPFQLETLLKAYLTHFELVTVDTQKGWMRLVFQKNGIIERL